MNFFANQLLTRVAQEFQQQKESFSRKEIMKKINEIKYLSSQKKVPKLSLRKEIIHLEEQLKGITQLETALLKMKKQESAKVGALKRQNTYLKKKLLATEDKHLPQKVEKLSHLLGDCLARHDVQKAVNTTHLPPKTNQPINVEAVMQRLEDLRNQLELNKAKDPTRVESMEQQIDFLENKLKLLQMPVQTSGEVKHNIMFQHTPPPKPERG
jgi:hypothetical protein